MSDKNIDTDKDFKIEPGGRLPTEPWQAFQVFQKYRDLRPSERGMSGLAKLVGKSEATLYAWAKKYNWRDRLCEYLDYEDKKLREINDLQLKEMRARHARMGMKMLIKAEKRLDSLDENQLSPADVVKLAVEGAKIEQKALGDVTESIKIKHEGNVNLSHSQVASKILGDEELTKKLMDEIDMEYLPKKVEQLELKEGDNE